MIKLIYKDTDDKEKIKSLKINDVQICFSLS